MLEMDVSLMCERGFRRGEGDLYIVIQCDSCSRLPKKGKWKKNGKNADVSQKVTLPKNRCSLKGKKQNNIEEMAHGVESNEGLLDPKSTVEPLKKRLRNLYIETLL